MKQDIGNHLLDSEITSLSFNPVEFKAISWIEEEEEFSKDGILYDVVSIDKKENGNYIIKAISDKKETGVLNALQNDVGSNSSSKKCTHLLFQLFTQRSSAQDVFNPYHHPNTIENSFIYLNHYSFLDSKKTSPPPKSVS